jgi:hypothetical protein
MKSPGPATSGEWRQRAGSDMHGRWKTEGEEL